MAFFSQLLLKIINPFETVLLVVTKESTMRTYLHLVCCANDIHHYLVELTNLGSFLLLFIKWLILQETFLKLNIFYICNRRYALELILIKYKSDAVIERWFTYIFKSLLTELTKNNFIFSRDDFNVTRMTYIMSTS